MTKDMLDTPVVFRYKYGTDQRASVADGQGLNLVVAKEVSYSDLGGLGAGSSMKVTFTRYTRMGDHLGTHGALSKSSI